MAEPTLYERLGGIFAIAVRVVCVSVSHMNSLMAFATDNQRLASSSSHDMHPLWFFSLPLFLEVCRPSPTGEWRRDERGPDP